MSPHIPPRPGSAPPTTPGRRLIHPVMVPPPAADAVPAAAHDETALAPAPRRSDEDTPTTSAGPGLPSLKRRVPQTHLAPELIRPDGGRGPGAPPQGDRGEGDPLRRGGGTLEALSRYQASRDAARTEIESTVPEPEGERP
jgi:hypothetical protein